jgi:hypothetical protein
LPPLLSLVPGPASGDSAAEDPFFVPLSGTWEVDRLRSQPLDPVWRSMGVGRLARLVVGAVEITTLVSHTRHILATDDSSALGAHRLVLPLDGQWRPMKQADGRWMLVRATHVHGAGDRGPQWMGYEAAAAAGGLEGGDGGEAASAAPAGGAPFSPRAAATVSQLPVFSALAFEPHRYSTSTITVETLLVDIGEAARALRASHAADQGAAAGAGGAPRGAAADRGHNHARPLAPAVAAAVAAGLPLWQALPWAQPAPRGPQLLVTHRLESRTVMTQQYTHVGAGGEVVSSAERLLVRRESEEELDAGARAEKKRLAHVRAVVLSRRADADKARRKRLADESAEAAAAGGGGGGGGDGGAAGGYAAGGAAADSTAAPAAVALASVAADPWAAINHDESGEDPHGEGYFEGCGVM